MGLIRLLGLLTREVLLEEIKEWGKLNNMRAKIMTFKLPKRHVVVWVFSCHNLISLTVDPTRSMGRRDSLLIEKSELIFEL